MAKERNALRAGIFIIVSVVLIIGIIVAIKGFGRLIEPNQTRPHGSVQASLNGAPPQANADDDASARLTRIHDFPALPGTVLGIVGHDVRIGTRDVEALMARSEPDARGGESFAQWAAHHPAVVPATFSDAAAHGEVVVNATNGGASLDVLRAAGEANLAGKVLIDIAQV